MLLGNAVVLAQKFLVAHMDILVQTWSLLHCKATQNQQQQQLGQFVVTAK